MNLKKYMSYRDIEVFNSSTNTLETRSIEIHRFESEQEHKLKIKYHFLWTLSIICFIGTFIAEALICTFIQNPTSCCLMAFGLLIVSICAIYLVSCGIDKMSIKLEKLNNELWKPVFENIDGLTTIARIKAKKWREAHPVEEAIRQAIENKDSVSITKMLKEINDVNNRRK